MAEPALLDGREGLTMQKRELNAMQESKNFRISERVYPY